MYAFEGINLSKHCLRICQQQSIDLEALKMLSKDHMMDLSFHLGDRMKIQVQCKVDTFAEAEPRKNSGSIGFVAFPEFRGSTCGSASEFWGRIVGLIHETFLRLNRNRCTVQSSGRSSIVPHMFRRLVFDVDKLVRSNGEIPFLSCHVYLTSECQFRRDKTEIYPKKDTDT